MNKFKERIVKALLPYITLTLAEKQPIHGYALINHIRQKYGVYLSPSMVYPALKQLEQAGFLKTTWQTNGDRPRKLYTPTHEGLTLLTETALTLTKFPCRLGEVK